MPTSPSATHNQNLGKIGENLACDYLIKQGYVILERNYRYHHKEIDIIAREQNTIVVVEVKTRSVNPVFDGSWAINRKKIANITSAGYAYADKHLPNDGVRFDSIICQQNADGDFTITHEKDAFYAPCKFY